MVDFDGVLADLSSAFITGCNDRFGTSYTVEDEDDWNWWRRQPPKFADYVWKELYPDADWFLSEVRPYPDAIQALADLMTNLDGIVSDEEWDTRSGPPVQIITARSDDQTPMVKPWLEKYLPRGIEVYVFGMGSSGFKKSDFCHLRRLNVVVDDGAHNLRSFNSYSTKLFLVERPWNAKELLANVTRVAGLQDAVNLMTEEAAAA